MDSQKLKIKVGDHEFEAEGPPDVVQAQFAAWRDLVAALPAAARPAVHATAATPAENQPAITNTVTDSGSLDKITRHDGRIVSLTVRGASVEDEIMLVLYGQKMLRDNDAVTGSEVLEGLRLTGRTVARADYQLDKMTEAGDVITVGVGRARRYRLTNQGITKARELARSLIAKVA